MEKTGEKATLNRIRLFWTIVRRYHFEKILILFTLCFFVTAAIIRIVEPSIETYGDACWFTFAACSTIGFGDIVVVTFIGRILTIFITIFEVVLITLLSGVIVSHYLEVVQIREKETATIFLDKLTRLSSLNHEELVKLENKVKKFTR